MTSPIRFCFSLLLLGLLGGPFVPSAADPIDPTSHVYRTVAGESLRAYVFSPEPGPDLRSGILLFHGGGWSHGRPEWTFDAARRFAAHGLVAIAVEYRLSNETTTPIDALTDVCAAVRWTRAQAESLSLASDRIAAYGVSAGGHLAASTATVGCPSAPDASTRDLGPLRSTPDALLLWSPALDVVRDGWFRRLLQDRAPAIAYSPVEHVQSTTPPTSIVQGAADTLTPVSGARTYCTRLTAEGGTCDLNIFQDVGHLLTRNLDHQESNFDPDPQAVREGIDAHLSFLRTQGFIREK